MIIKNASHNQGYLWKRLRLIFQVILQNGL